MMHFSPQNTLNIVQTALDLTGQRPLVAVPDPTLFQSGEIKQFENDHLIFHLPVLMGSWAACSEGLAHPHSGEIRPISFDQNFVSGRDDVVLAHLNHRLVQMSLRLLRAEVWSPASRKGLHRLTACVVPDSALRNPAVVAFARLVVIGGDQNRLHEEIIAAGGELVEAKFIRLNVSQTQALLEAMTLAEPAEHIRSRLLSFYSKIAPALANALEARGRDRMEGIHKLLAERADFEARSIQSIMSELANAIRKEVDEPEFRQLELWTSEEREQLERNMEALRRRLKAIPDEIEQEQKAIHRRFADPQVRLFPVAVAFLVPEKLAR